MTWAILFGVGAEACTTFYLDGLFGKSYDWSQETAAIIVNKANVTKRSLPLLPSDKSFEWTSKYANATFNQYGQEFPLGGMNEKGLTVEIMILTSSQFPPADSRGSLNELQWIQYQLDNFATVAEAVAAEKATRISKVYANVHYLMCDRTKACATFEYLKGKPVIHTGESLPHSALANDTYTASLDRLSHFKGYGGAQTPPGSATGSLDRFVVAVTRTKGAKSTLENAFDTLSRVRAEGTRWNIVYDTQKAKVHFRTSRYSEIKTFDLSTFDVSCKELPQHLDIQTKVGGEVTKQFKPFTLSDNEKLVKESLAELGLPAAVIQKAADYPKSTACSE